MALPLQLHRWLACLCIAALLIGVMTPAGAGLPVAMLVTIGLLAAVLSGLRLRREGTTRAVQLLGFLTLSLTRVPPLSGN